MNWLNLAHCMKSWLEKFIRHIFFSWKKSHKNKLFFNFSSLFFSEVKRVKLYRYQIKYRKKILIFFRSHCACDDIFYKCLKAVTEPNPDTNAMEIAENLGRIYFNVLSLECAEPSYPKVCLHYTKALPGSIGEKSMP